MNNINSIEEKYKQEFIYKIMKLYNVSYETAEIIYNNGDFM